MDILVTLVIVSALFWFGRRAIHSSVVFAVRLRDGQPETLRGAVTPAFLDAVRDLCRDHGVTQGELRGYSSGGPIRLWFSAHIPEGFRQQLRNWWTISGWPLKVRSSCR